jgi:hypothetical protein
MMVQTAGKNYIFQLCTRRDHPPFLTPDTRTGARRL